MANTWIPKREEKVLVTAAERELYVNRDRRSTYHGFQWPGAARKGIDKSGHFPIAVVRKQYSDRGYECWISARNNEVCPSYLLERLPVIGQRKRDLAYCRIETEFGPEVLRELHDAAAQERRKRELRAAGGDPDLFVKNRSDPTDRFFAEVKLIDPARRYQDTPNDQQKLLFPLIERILKCDVRMFVVTVSTPDGDTEGRREVRGKAMTESGDKPSTEIIWKEADDLERVGHGILFGHDRFPRLQLAFAVGFEWLHQPGTPVTVQVLSSPPPGITEQQWPDILAQVRQGVVKYFGDSQTPLDVRVTMPIWTWING